MSDIFEEAEEALRVERYKRLARIWLPVLGGALVLALIAALGWWGWQSYQTARAATASVAYERGLDAIQANDAAAAESAFQEAEREGNPAYKTMALMQRAGLAVAGNRIPDAITLFDQAAKVAGDPLLSDPAALKAVYLVMDTGASFEEVERRVRPLTREGRPYRGLALEALGMAQIQHGKTTEARATFVQLQLGQDVPETVRQRAQMVITMIDNGTVSGLATVIEAQAEAAAVIAPPASEASPSPSAAPAE